MTEEYVAELRPTYWRLLWRSLFYSVTAAFLVVFIGHLPWYDFLVVASVLVFQALFTTSDPGSMSISISTWRVSGPSAGKGQRMDIPLEEVEIVLSRHLHTGIDSLYNRHWIYSSGVKKILLLGDGFPKGTFEQLLDTIVRLQREAVASQ